MESCETKILNISAQPDPRNLLKRIKTLEEQLQRTQQRCDDLETELIREKWHRQELQWQLQENHQTEMEGLKLQMSSLTLHTQSGMAAVSAQLSAVSSLLRTVLASKVCDLHKRSQLECLLCAIGSNASLAAFILEQSKQVETLLLTRNNNGETPLLVAVESGQLEIVKLLVKYSSPLSLSLPALKTEQNALHYAAALGHTDIAKYLLEVTTTPKFYVNALDDEQQTPLFLACRQGHLEVAKILVEKGANPCIKRNDGCTPLHAASFYGHHQVVLWLLEQGDITVMLDSERNTALHYAALGGHISLMEILVKNGFSLASTNIWGMTPLAMAGVPQSKQTHVLFRNR